MAIIITLDRMLQARGMTLSELAGRIDITLANLSILKTGKAKAIRFSTLEALCRELNCQPGDILVWDPDEAAAELHEDDGRAVAGHAIDHLVAVELDLPGVEHGASNPRR